MSRFTKLRVIAGPEVMHVVRYGHFVAEIPLSADDDAASIRSKARGAWLCIQPDIASARYFSHRLHIACDRSMAAKAIELGFIYPGPRPGLISKRPWSESKKGDFTALPSGVVARAVRASR